MQRQAPETGLELDRPGCIGVVDFARLLRQAHAPETGPFEKERNALTAGLFTDDGAGQMAVGRTAAFARHDGQGGIDLRRLQELAVDDGIVVWWEEVGQKLHAVHLADPRFAEGRLEEEVQVPGETFAEVLQRPAAAVGERAPAFDGAGVGEEAHVPPDFGAVRRYGR